MSAAAPPAPAPATVSLSPPASALAGTGHLLRFILRRDAVRLAVWVLALAALCLYYVSATGALYPSAGDRQNRAATMATPSAVLLGGPGYGLGDYSFGAMFANEMTLWLMVLLAAMNIVHVTRNTRAEEASGRAELVRALPVGCHAGQVAAFLAVAIADAIFTLLASALLIGVGDLPTADTITTMTAVTTAALVFAAMATLSAQVSIHPRGASGLALAALGVAALTRGIGDVLGERGSWISWLSPLAWSQQVRAYVDLRTWPLALGVLAVAALLSLAALLATRRDLGEALIHERPGPAQAAARLRNPLGLAIRQQRTALSWWLIGCTVMFALSGLFITQGTSQALQEIAGQDALTAQIFGDDPMAAFLGILMLHNAMAVAVYAITGVLRIKAEEDQGRLALGLSRSVSRTNALLSHLAVVTLGAFTLLLVGGALALWAGGAASGGDVALATLVTSAGAFALGIAVVIAFTAALYAWAPRATPLAWALFAILVIESFFGTLLNLPQAISALSPFWWIGNYPAAALDPLRLLALLAAAAAAVLIVLAVGGIRRRDLTTG